MKIDEKDRAIILLCSLPGFYEHLVTTLTYGKEDVKVDEIVLSTETHRRATTGNTKSRVVARALEALLRHAPGGCVKTGRAT